MTEPRTYAKVDLKKTLDGYRAKAGEFRILEIPDATYLMIDGHGDPNTSTDYTDALAALYPVAYKLKFASKTRLGRDYVVPPLEGLWWADDLRAFTSARDKSRWDWTLMLMVPQWARDLFDDAITQVRDAKSPARLSDVRLASLSEGQSVQTLHLGPYDDEAAVLELMHDRFIPERGLQPGGKHHEVYLSDARRVAPEKLRTILRQPVVAGRAD